MAIAAFACWTNVLGHVLVAEPVSISGGRVSFAVPAAGAVATNTCPLSAFPAAERARMRAALGAAQPPADAAAANRMAFAEREEDRIAAMERDGLLTAEEAAGRREALRRFMGSRTGSRAEGAAK